jgi:hypothetical protein
VPWAARLNKLSPQIINKLYLLVVYSRLCQQTRLHGVDRYDYYCAGNWSYRIEAAEMRVLRGAAGYTSKCQIRDAKIKVKLSLQQTVEARRVVRRRGSHIF